MYMQRFGALKSRIGLFVIAGGLRNIPYRQDLTSRAGIPAVCKLIDS